MHPEEVPVKLLDRFLRFIDLLSEWTGKAASFFIVSGIRYLQGFGVKKVLSNTF